MISCLNRAQQKKNNNMMHLIIIIILIYLHREVRQAGDEQMTETKKEKQPR